MLAILRGAFGESRAAIKEAIRLFNEAEKEAEADTGQNLTDPIIALAKSPGKAKRTKKKKPE